MRFKIVILLICIISFISCYNKGIKFEIFSNGQKRIEILPKDIEFYDTTQERNGFGIVEMRLKKGFYNQDSIVLNQPVILKCFINDKEYFWSDLFYKSQSAPRLWLNFNFRSLCFNGWSFPDENPNRVILHTKNECNSIEFFHRRKDITESLEDYFMKQKYFRDYIDTARLAHELLLDPYYLDALKESGVEIR
ncbi:MAG: hypothetical protein R2771_08575 [Saprospiraceae bacterium]